MDYVFVSFLFDLMSFFIFIDAFIEYSVVRYDLSATQLELLYESLPGFIKVFRKPADENSSERFIKDASWSSVRTKMGLAALGPLLTLVGFYISFTGSDFVSALLHLLLLLSCFYVLFRCFRTIRHIH
jgi:hypothetical protein